MARSDDKFKHFAIDETKVERLIEMWKHFNPNDDPKPLTAHSVYVNEKYPDVANHAFMEVLKYQVYDESCHRIDRWQVCSQNIRTEDPVNLMYDRFVEVKSGGIEKPKKTAVEELEDEEVEVKGKKKDEKKTKRKKK